MFSFRAVAPLALLLATAACGPAIASSDPGFAAPSRALSSSSVLPDMRPPSRGMDVSTRLIGPRALQSQGARTLVEAITAYWPNVESPGWLAPNTPSGERLGVYSRGAYVGTLETVRDIPASRIASVRRLTPVDERLYFGQMHPAGALVIEWVAR